MTRLLVLIFAALAFAAPAQAAVDLSTYQRVGRYDVPASEASAVTYDADTDSLFVVGDEGTAVVQVDKTGHAINQMAVTGFDDTEGLTYVGGGKFVLVEERVRQVNLFTYVAGGTLTRAAVQTVKLANTVGNIGIEGVSNDPLNAGGLIGVKEKTPEGIFATVPNWAAGTASNGSPTADNPADLFDPALAGLPDFSDVYAVADGTLLILSQEGGRIVDVSRSGQVLSALNIVGDADNPLSVPDQGHEGVTMDPAGRLYTVSEQGGGANKPQLWVYAPGSAPAPSVTLTNGVTSLPATTSTATRVKVADVTVTVDSPSSLHVTGADASSFEVDASGLYIKAGTVLSKPSYTVSVASTNATSTALTITITSPATVAITEVAPWGSSASYAADWWELTNTGTAALDLTGFKMDDSSNALATAVALNGVTSVAPGQSVIFLEGDATKAAAFKTFWGIPNVAVGYYSGSGVGLSTDGDGVNVFDGAGNRVTGVTFGASTNNVSFDNVAGLGLSVAGRNGAYVAGGATGGPGAVAPSLAITEVASWGSSASYAADWWEVTNTGAHDADLTGFKMDDSSNLLSAAVALNGVTSVAPGQSVIFLEGDATKAAAFKTFWGIPNVAVGYYSGSGVGLSTDGDAVNLFDQNGKRLTGVTFGAATTNVSFDTVNGVTLSVKGIRGAYTTGGATGSPGTIKTIESPPADGGVVGTVPAQLSVLLGGPAMFAPFIAGVERDYAASTTATVISTAGDATLSVADNSAVATGHLLNGTFALPSALQGLGTLKTYSGPVTNDVVNATFTQHIGINDALRTGGYTKTLTFTLSTTTP